VCQIFCTLSWYFQRERCTLVPTTLAPPFTDSLQLYSPASPSFKRLLKKLFENAAITSEQ
jgi:hypothetical protein